MEELRRKQQDAAQRALQMAPWAVSLERARRRFHRFSSRAQGVLGLRKGCGTAAKAQKCTEVQQELQARQAEAHDELYDRLLEQNEQQRGKPREASQKGRR